MPILLTEKQAYRSLGFAQWTTRKPITEFDRWSSPQVMKQRSHSPQPQSLESLAHLIVAGISDTESSDYFYKLTENLVQATGADHALVARAARDSNTARTVALISQGQRLDNIEYSLKDTPCAHVLHNNFCVFPKNVSEIFTNDRHLQLMKGQAYLGVRLSARSGDTLGLIAIIYSAPITEQEYLLTLLQIFAVPAAVELSRQRDQRSRELLERRLGSILSIAQEAIIATDENFNIILFNQGAESVFGYKSNEVLGNSINILIPDEIRARHQQEMEGFSGSEEISRLMSQRDGNIVGVRSDGQIFPAEASITKSQFEDGMTITIVLRDITERKQSEIALQSASRMQTLGNLAAGLAHDFNNLLTLIRGSLELATRETGSEKNKQDHLDVAIRATDRGAELVSRLLAFGRPRALKSEALCPTQLIEQLIEMLQVTLGAHIDVRFVKGASHCRIFADPSQLENAIVNLSFNARDAMPSGGTLTIDVECIQIVNSALLSELQIQRGEYVCITVADTGSGMTAETQKNAMEPFYSTKFESGGSGLGLSMVFGFVKSANGAVRIQSRIGEGTIIKLYFPAHKHPETTSTNTDKLPGGTEKVLIVEDQSEVRELAVMYAEMLGYCVLQAGDGPQALEQLEKHPDIDLLFTDYQLPNGYSGLDLAEIFTKAIPAIKILISSGYDTQDYGLTDYSLLPKPYTLQTFAKYLRSVLDD